MIYVRISFYPNHNYSLYQVIVEKAPKARVVDIDKKKYLVPSDLTGEVTSILSDISIRNVICIKE